MTMNASFKPKFDRYVIFVHTIWIFGSSNSVIMQPSRWHSRVLNVGLFPVATSWTAASCSVTSVSWWRDDGLTNVWWSRCVNSCFRAFAGWNDLIWKAHVAFNLRTLKHKPVMELDCDVCMSVTGTAVVVFLKREAQYVLELSVK